MQEILANTIEMYRTGQLGPAAPMYPQVFIQQRENAEAMHLLGVPRQQRGELARAVELIGRSARCFIGNRWSAGRPTSRRRRNSSHVWRVK
jgi:hypothetical protein